MEEFSNVWGRAVDADKRGRHKTMQSAISAALKDLLTERNTFFDTVNANWRRLFPDQPCTPGCWHDGYLVLYVKKSTTLFLMRQRLPQIKRRLAELPGAPKRFNVRIEIHA